MRLMILGGGGHAAVVAEAIQAMGGHDLVGFHDDDLARRLAGLPHRGAISEAWRTRDADGIVLGVGHAHLRREWLAAAIAASLAAPAIIHPRAWVSPSACLGLGVVVMAGAIIQARAVIGAGAIINTGASVDHDSVVGDHAHLAPGARLAGGVTVGAGAFIGMMACVIEGRTVGDGALIAAGAVVVHDVEAGLRVAGVPARAMPHRG